MINWIKTKIIVWAFNSMIEKFITGRNDEIIEIHLKTGHIVYTHFDDKITAVETLLHNSRLQAD